MSSASRSNHMANRTNGPIKEQAPSLSNLTVENVTKLELEYDSIDGDRRKVEDYITKNQLEELERTTGFSSPDSQDEGLVKRGTNTTVDDLCEYDDSNEAQTEFPTKQCRKETSSKSEKKQITNLRKFPCKNVQTQTECNEHHVATTSKNGSVTSENTVERGTSDFKHDGTKTFRQLPLSCEGVLLKEMEVTISSCEFCHFPKKIFPTIEQLASEPGSKLFCCVKIQELFQYMIMDTIESYTPEKTEKETEDEQTAAHISDEMKALSELREQIKKTDTKEYITYLANHLSTHGSLFLMEKISFTLTSADTITNCTQSKDAFSDPAHNIDDYFIPLMDNELIKKPRETIKQCYHSGQNFLILFPDGTGQVLYPSGNIGILIACSKPTQIMFIILEDAEKKPQIQAIFMSNGHGACYHHNGTLWTVLDPYGGSCFDEDGARKKHWTWWDFSKHVHAPPFQPITFMLNSNMEVKIFKQDEVYLSFTKDKEKIIFNVGSKLLLNDPEITSKVRWNTGKVELYCSSKKLEIFRLLNKIRKLVKISATSQDREDIILDYVHQLQKSLNVIIALTSKQANASINRKAKEIQESVTAIKYKKKKPSLLPGSTLPPKPESPNGGGKKEPTHSSNKPKVKH